MKVKHNAVQPQVYLYYVWCKGSSMLKRILNEDELLYAEFFTSLEHMWRLRRHIHIRRFLTSTATATLVSSFVLSRIEYCNSLLLGSTHDVTSHLQRTQNYAARVILRLPKSSSIIIHLKSLH